MTREQYLTYRRSNDIYRIIWEGLNERGFRKDYSLFMLEYSRRPPSQAKMIFEEGIINHYDILFHVTLINFGNKRIGII